MTTGIDPGIVLKATRDAHTALTSAMSIVQQKQTDLATRLSAATGALNAAKTLADELETEAAKPSPDLKALQAKVALANEKSAAALKSSSELIGAVGFIGAVGSPVDEWKECRTTIDRFDKILVDLRKTGFGFVTAIAAGAQFLFTDSNSFAAKAALLAMLVVLIITLYWIDLAHQIYLDVAVRRARHIETHVLFGTFSLTNDIGEKFKPVRAITLGLFLYMTLLVATCAVFFFSVPKDEPFTSGHHGLVGIAFGIGLALIVGGWIFSDEHRKVQRVFGLQAQHVFVLCVVAIALSTIVGHYFMHLF